MKKQFAALLALSTAAACVLSYQPVQAGAESVLGSMTQENLTDITNEHSRSPDGEAVLRSSGTYGKKP